MLASSCFRTSPFICAEDRRCGRQIVMRLHWRCPRCRTVMHLLQRTVLIEVGENSADGARFFTAGDNPYRAAAVNTGGDVDVERIACVIGISRRLARSAQGRVPGVDRASRVSPRSSRGASARGCDAAVFDRYRLLTVPVSRPMESRLSWLRALDRLWIRWMRALARRAASGRWRQHRTAAGELRCARCRRP